MISKYISKFKKTLLVTLMLITSLSIAPSALAATGPFSPTTAKQEACQGLTVQNTGGSTPCDTINGGLTLGKIINDVINILSILIGAIAIIMIIVGGFKFVTSGGDSSKVGSARNTIMYALVGIVVAALAQVLVHFVLTRFNS